MTYTKRKYIYYSKLFNLDGKLIDERLSFGYQQYHGLKSMHGEEHVFCMRMRMDDGVWESYPEQE